MLNKLEKLIPVKSISYKLTRPFLATILQHYALSKTDQKDQTFHIVLSLKDSGINYLPGQSIGVIPPGQRDGGRPHKPRLYSIASDSTGDNEFPNSVSFTVKRLLYKNESGKEVLGLCSDYLCSAKIGDKIPITSPSGRVMLLPKSNKVDLILIGTGTGVAPYRAFLQYIARQPAPWSGTGLIYVGYKFKEEALYCNEYNQELVDFCQDNNFKLRLALSRQEKNPAGQKMYVADRMRQDLEKLKSIMIKNNFSVYLCGLKNMEAAVDAVFAQISQELNQNWPDLKKSLRASGRWNVEVY